MFDISTLKEMKLSELQEIAKLAKTIKIAGVKKDELIAQILKHQNKATETESGDATATGSEKKGKRTRMATGKNPGSVSDSTSDLFSAEPIVKEMAEDFPKKDNPKQNRKNFSLKKGKIRTWI
jgi:transcription termination factor Rho